MAMSRRRSSTRMIITQRRKMALARIVTTPMASWKREITRKVALVSSASAALPIARVP